MKILLLTLLVSLTFLSCEESMPTGSENVTEFDNVKFVVNSKEVVDNTFFVKGTVTNNGELTFTPTWFMEAQFYNNNQQSIKLGGAVDRFNFSLKKGETTEWSLTYKNSDQNLNDYPNFGVGNLRAYKMN